jgi:hypothetical protein
VERPQVLRKVSSFDVRAVVDVRKMCVDVGCDVIGVVGWIGEIVDIM